MAVLLLPPLLLWLLPCAVALSAIHRSGPSLPDQSMNGGSSAPWPGAREGATAVRNGGGAVWVYAGNGYLGSGAVGLTGEFWVYTAGLDGIDPNAPQSGEWAEVRHWQRAWPAGGSGVVDTSGTYFALGAASARSWPGCRAEHAAWLGADGALFLFGGNGVDPDSVPGPRNDLWKYQENPSSWTWLGGDIGTGTAGKYGSAGEEILWPGARSGHTVVLDASGSAWLFGGIGVGESVVAGRSVLSDLWSLSPDARIWSFAGGSRAINSRGEFGSDPWPGARQGHVSWRSAANEVCLFAGRGYGSAAFGYLNDMWCFSVDGTQWRVVGGSEAPGEVSRYTGADAWPGGLTRAAVVKDQRGTVWLFGGYGYATADSAGYLHDLWAWGADTDQVWTHEGGSKQTNSAGIYGTQGSAARNGWPGGRQSALLWVDHANTVWLFAGRGFGSTGVGILADVWSFASECDSQTAASRIAQSITSCVVTTGMRCDYGCADGYSAVGLHVCADGVLTGGQCVAATCSAPILSGKEIVVVQGCEDGGELGQMCELGCAPGYRKLAGIEQPCLSDPGEPTASYQNVDVACLALTCEQVALPEGRVVVSGCSAGGGLGAPCVLGCAPGWLATVTHRYARASCSPDIPNGTVSYKANIVCSNAYADVELASGAAYASVFTWEGGASEPNVHDPPEPRWPGPRSRHVSLVVRDSLVVFGGLGYAEGSLNATLDSTRGGTGYGDAADVSETIPAGAQNDLWLWRQHTWKRLGGSEQSDAHASRDASAQRQAWPGARFGHAAWQTDSGALIFGGMGLADSGPSGLLADLWSLEVYASDGVSWRSFGPTAVNSAGHYHVQGVAGGWPGARRGHVVWCDQVLGGYTLWGGFGYGDSIDETGYLNDLWTTDGASFVWQGGGGDGIDVRSSIASASASAVNWPGGRADGAVTPWDSIRGVVWLFGGFGYSTDGSAVRVLQDLWSWDGRAWTWISSGNQTEQSGGRPIATQAIDVESWPGARASHTLWLTDAGDIFLFGGTSGSDSNFNDMWSFVSNSTWLHIVQQWSTPGADSAVAARGSPSLDTWPRGRAGHSLSVDQLGTVWMFGGSAEADESSPSLLQDLFSLAAWCTDGLLIEHSPTRCAGTVSQSCDYVCEDGYAKRGDHVCSADRVFRGGSCVASQCEAFTVSFGQVVVRGCGAGGQLNRDECEIGCMPGYVASQMTVGLCSAVASSSAAQYQGQHIRCTPSVCGTPPTLLHETIEHGCAANGSLGDTCTLGCRWLKAASVAVGVCAPDGAGTTASYQGQFVDCKVAAAIGSDWGWSQLRVSGASAREGHRIWTDSRQRIWMFGGYGRAHNGETSFLADMFSWNGVQFELVDDGMRSSDAIFGETWPSARSEFAAWSDATGLSFVFAGYGIAEGSGLRGIDSQQEVGYLSDLWSLDVGTRIWTHIGGPLTANAYGTYTASAVSAAWPGSRKGHAMWRAGDADMLFGGFGMAERGPAGCLSDLWALEDDDCGSSLSVPGASFHRCGDVCVLSTTGCSAPPKHWTFHAGGQTTNAVSSASWPAGRAHVAVASSADQVYLFGGVGMGRISTGGFGVGLLADLWLWSPLTGFELVAGDDRSNAGGELNTEGVGGDPSSIPGGRHGAAFWAVTSTTLFLHGGFGMSGSVELGADYLTDLWVFDIPSGVFTWVGGSSTPGAPDAGSTDASSVSNWPSARANHQVFSTQPGIWNIFGGVGILNTNLQPSLLGNVFSLAAWCTDGLLIEHSPTRCAGTVSQSCDYVCEDGYAKRGDHVCSADRVFRGGSCVASQCEAFTVSFGQVVVRGCGAGGQLNRDECEIGCMPGYVASQMTVGLCSAVASSSAAQYQGQHIRCVAFSVTTAGVWFFAAETSVDAYGLYPGASAASQSSRPGSRVHHAAAQMGQSVYVFGGEGFERNGERRLSNEMWRADDNIRWTYIGGGQADTDNPVDVWPGARKGHCLHGFNDVIILFGGQVDAESFSTTADVWEWSDAWSLLGSSGESWPAGRSMFASWAITDSSITASLWVFGGLGDGTDILNDLWQYSSTRWTQFGGERDPVPEYGTRGQPAGSVWPGGRWGAASWSGQQGLMVFGGEGIDAHGLAGHLADLWRYDQSMWCWLGGPVDSNQASSFNADHAWPGSRTFASVWDDDAAVFLFGGEYACAQAENGKCFLNDLWRFDIAEGTFLWTAGSRTANSIGTYTYQRTADEHSWLSARSGAVVWKGETGAHLFGGEGYVTTGATGVLMDIWVIARWCKADAVVNSPTHCSGTVDSICEYACDDGHVPDGAHVCAMSGFFSGGACVPSTCETPLLLSSQKVSFGCSNSGSHGDLCHLACADDYWAMSDPIPGVCTADSGSSTSSYKLQTTSCAMATSCSSLEFESVSPTSESDRQCANLTVCTEDEYELVAPTLTTNRVCSLLSVCTDSEYEIVPASSASDRECAILRECGPAEFELIAPTTVSDRVCAPVTRCGEEQYQVRASTPFANTLCRPVSACTFWQYEVLPPTATSNRVCAPWCAVPELTAGQMVVSGCDHQSTLSVACSLGCATGFTASAPSDGICAIVDEVPPDDVCAAAGNMVLCGTGSCVPRLDCAVAKFVGQAVTCRSFSSGAGACWRNKAIDHSPTWCYGELGSTCDYKCSPGYGRGGPRTCVSVPYIHPDCSGHGIIQDCYKMFEGGSCTACGPGKYKSGVNTRQCSDCLPGKYQSLSATSGCASCAEGRFSPLPGAAECMDATVCLDSEYESAAPTSTEDRHCLAISTCTEEQFELEPPSSTSDRVCASPRVCGDDEYQTRAATAVSDTECAATTVCDAESYEVQPPTQDSDRECALLTECNTCEEQPATIVCDPCQCDANGIVNGIVTNRRGCAVHVPNVPPFCYVWPKCAQSSSSGGFPGVRYRWCDTVTDVASDGCDEAIRPVNVCVEQYERVAPTSTRDRQCEPKTICTAVEFEAVASTAVTDRLCSPATVCSVSEYEMQALTTTRDRSCAPLTVCTATEFETFAGNSTSDRDCTGLTSCSSLEFESVSPTSESDRQCANLTVCTEDEYELVAPTLTTNRVCSLLSVCTDSEYEIVPASSASDRECAILRECGPAEFELIAPTTVSDRVCAPVTRCGEEQYQVRASTAFTDAVCANITACGASEYEELPATPLSDRKCIETRVCTADEFEQTQPTLHSDRICRPLTVCDQTTEYEVLAATYRRDRICATARVCSLDQYEVAAKTATRDRTCAALSVCATEEYEGVRPTLRNDRGCFPATRCGSDQYESQALTATADRVCTYLSICNIIAQGERGEYESVQPTTTTDRICKNLTVCSVTEYESVPPTSASDRVCTAATSCDSLEWESKSLRTTSDRECTPITVCDFPSTYEFRAPSDVSDRFCANVIDCKPDVEWEKHAPTQSSQRICMEITSCGGSTYEMVPATLTTDAVCQENVVALSGSAIANITFAMDFSEVNDIGAAVFADRLVQELASLLQIDRSRLVVSRLLPGSIIAEVLVQPHDGKIPAVELIQRLQTMHSNPDSHVYDQDQFPLLSQMDRTRQISFQGMREGIDRVVVLYFLAGGGCLVAVGLCLLAQARSAIKPGRRYTDDHDSTGTRESGGRRLLHVALGAASFGAHLLFCFVVLRTPPEFAYEHDQFVELTFYTTSTLFLLGPGSVALSLVWLWRQKRRLVHATEIDTCSRGRVAAIGLLSLFQPELLPFLPWHPSQGLSVEIVVGLHAALECTLHLLFQMDYSARRGGLDVNETPDVIAAGAMAVTILSIMARVVGRYASRLYKNYAARVTKLRTKMKVVPQYRADRPNTTPVPQLGELDPRGVLDEKTRRFLPTAIMCGLESEHMMAEIAGRGLQISRGTVSAGALLEKHWTLRNLGKVAWPKRAKLVCIGGDEPGLDVLTIPEIPGWVGPGSEIQLKVRLRAPSEPGAFVKYFRLQDMAGRLFGQRLWAQATVHSSGDVDTSVIDVPVVGHDGPKRLAMLVDADRKRKGSADAAHRRTDMRPISHTASFSLGLWEQAQVWQRRLEDPDYTASHKLPALPPVRTPGVAAAKRVGY